MKANIPATNPRSWAKFRRTTLYMMFTNRDITRMATWRYIRRVQWLIVFGAFIPNAYGPTFVLGKSNDAIKINRYSWDSPRLDNAKCWAKICHLWRPSWGVLVSKKANIWTHWVGLCEVLGKVICHLRCPYWGFQSQMQWIYPKLGLWTLINIQMWGILERGRNIRKSSSVWCGLACLVSLAGLAGLAARNLYPPIFLRIYI